MNCNRAIADRIVEKQIDGRRLSLIISDNKIPHLLGAGFLVIK